MDFTCYSSTRQLVLLYVLDNIELRKRSVYLQDIIKMGKINHVWDKVLQKFLSSPYKVAPRFVFSLN